jgi:Rrf2 family transcriptional regulator, cysteine metabolism repressor
MFSTKTRYSLRALIVLGAYTQNNKPLFLKQIAKMENLPVKYLEGLFHVMKKAGYVKSIRGAHGGYLLAKKEEEITLLNIVELFEVNLLNLEEVAEVSARECVSMHLTDNLYKKVLESFRLNLGDYSLKELVDEYKANQSQGLTYSI